VELKDIKLNSLGLLDPNWGRIVTFVDFGNVNYWFDKDERDWNDDKLPVGHKLIVDIKKLSEFTGRFSTEKRFYYGWNPRKKSNWHLSIKAEKYGFIKITKPMQFVRIQLDDSALSRDDREVKKDRNGNYVEIPKSNFDVEISVDAVRIMKKYDTLCLFSGDSDFAYLSRFLKRNGKKIIVIAAGQVFHTLKEVADHYVNAQDIKADITVVKETSPLAGRSLDIGSAPGGQGGVTLNN